MSFGDQTRDRWAWLRLGCRCSTLRAFSLHTRRWYRFRTANHWRKSSVSRRISSKSKQSFPRLLETMNRINCVDVLCSITFCRWFNFSLLQISIQTTRGAHICGGALIGEAKLVFLIALDLLINFLPVDLRHVLTAAHCLTTDFGAVLELTSVKNIANYWNSFEDFKICNIFYSCNWWATTFLFNGGDQQRDKFVFQVTSLFIRVFM